MTQAKKSETGLKNDPVIRPEIDPANGPDAASDTVPKLSLLQRILATSKNPLPALRQVADEDLPALATQLRQATIDAVSVTGGHLGAGLGVVELTLALHHVFDTPHDRLIWDVGHQCYPHKILTGRADRIKTLRQGGGLSGFTRREESEFDPFGAGHSSTSISAALGMAVAHELQGKPTHHIAVIGDGAMSAGMAYEAMNNAGAMNAKLIVILNDNDMSIARPVGAMSHYLSRIVSSDYYRHLRHVAKDVLSHLPKRVSRLAQQAEEYARGLVAGGTLFEEMGFYYIGPIDGHNFDHLLPVLRNIRDSEEIGPVLIHVVTRKGHGYAPAEQSADKYHGVSKFDVETGAQQTSKPKAPNFTSLFGRALIAEGERDPNIIAITAAMPGGTGVGEFAARFPDRAFDVGIAEQHAVTFAAGLACEGMKPFVAIYSTFLQRAYDQIVHDVAIQSLPVRFAIDRAGLVGADGATHAGSFDIAFLACLPNFILMAAADEAELIHMVTTAASINDRPVAFRYPRGEGFGVALPTQGTVLPIGRGRMMRNASPQADRSKKLAILSFGARLHESLKAAEQLEAMGIATSVADARFCKPLDHELVAALADQHDALITIEEGSIGGFSAQVTQFLSQSGRLDGGLKLRSMFFPDIFIEHETPARQYEQAGLTAPDIITLARNLFSTPS